MSSTHLRYRRRYQSRTQSVEGRLDCDYTIKAILLGDLGVGKTTFLHTFMSDDRNFRAPPVPWGRGQGQISGGSGLANGHKIITYKDKRVKLTVWDTAGQERYRSLTSSYYRGAQACIIMYDVNNEESFRNVINWLESTNDYLDESSGGAVTMLVGINTGQGSPAHNHEAAEADTPTIPTTPTISNKHRVPAAPAVSQQRAESLAAHYQVPHMRLDSVRSPAGVAAVVEAVLTQVMTRAVSNATLSHTIRPNSVRLAKLANKRPHCSSCCSG